jgi:acetoin utilization deacetylase AcuC-like enzyme
VQGHRRGNAAGRDGHRDVAGGLRVLDANGLERREVERAADAAVDFGAKALVIALGVDAAIDDPESPLQVSIEGYHRAGDVLGALKLPTVVVQEGGYHLPTLGQLVGATLNGLGAHCAS